MGITIKVLKKIILFFVALIMAILEFVIAILAFSN